MQLQEAYNPCSPFCNTLSSRLAIKPVVSWLVGCLQVVCSAGVAAAAATHQHGQLHGQSCLLAPPVSLPSDQMEGFAHVEWISLITRHVCLDIMVPDQPDATQQLGR